MNVWIAILELFDLRMQKPEMYGWFHILWLIITAISIVLLCRFGKKDDPKQTRMIVLITAIVVAVLEIYKQINYTFSVDGNAVTADFQWYAFPFQFCSMPMYVGLLAGIVKKGKLQDCLYAFLATYGVFAGICVMFYPVDVFSSVIGISVQTMVCHGSMIAIGAYLFGCGQVKLEHRTILKAMSVFAVAVVIANILNEIAHQTGLLNEHTFNMFFVSPYCEPSLPVYSLVQAVVPFPWCLFIYIGAFTLASYIMLLIAMLANKLFTKTK